MPRTPEQRHQSALEGRANRGMPLEQRFWKKAVRDETTHCWNWQSTRTGRGYGSFTINNRPHSAHRVSWELVRGPIPEGLQVCHHCDNPRCVSPFHTFVGSNSDNQQDCIRKGRKPVFKGADNPMFGRRGEASAAAVLTDEQVLDIRSKYATGKFKQVDLARMFKVTQLNISAIVRGKTWAHLPLKAMPPVGRLTEEMKRVIEARYKEGTRQGEGSAHEIAKALGIPKYSVSGYYQRFKGLHKKSCSSGE